MELSISLPSVTKNSSKTASAYLLANSSYVPSQPWELAFLQEQLPEERYWPFELGISSTTFIITEVCISIMCYKESKICAPSLPRNHLAPLSQSKCSYISTQILTSKGCLVFLHYLRCRIFGLGSHDHSKIYLKKIQQEVVVLWGSEVSAGAGHEADLTWIWAR